MALVDFATLPVYRWKKTRAGEVRAVQSVTEPCLTMLFDAEGKYFGSVYAGEFTRLFELVTAPTAEGETK